MKKRKISMSLILALFLTFCISTVSYADIINTASSHNTEQQKIVMPMAIICPTCGIGSIYRTYEYSDKTLTGTHLCDEHSNCLIKIFECIKITKDVCNYCGSERIISEVPTILYEHYR